MEKEFLNLAKWVLDEIIKDGAETAFIEGDKDFKAQMAIAYVDAIGKKIQKIQTKYLTDETFKKGFQEFILITLKNTELVEGK